jgi:hypothetical protein
MNTLRSNKKRGKRKVVVNNRLIDTSRKILRSLLPQSLIVSQVIKQTGLSDRTYFFDIKDSLIKSKLIKQIPLNKRADILELDETGRDLATLEKYIEDAHQTLVRSIRKKFHINEYLLISRETALSNDEIANQIAKTLNSKLRDEGWNSDDLISYNTKILDALFFERKTAYTYIITLCSKYLFFLAKLGNNEIARSILHRTITNAFDEHFSRSAEALPDNFEKKEQLESNAALMISSLNHPVYEYIKEYAQRDESKIYLPPYNIALKNPNGFLANELREMIRAIFYLYGLGSEETNKEASDLTERYSPYDDSSDHVQK